MKKRVIVYLSGGIGNQIFQYSAGIFLADKCDGALILETRLGFLVDRKYRRKFLLNRVFGLSCKSTSLIDTLILIAYLMKRKFLKLFKLSTKSFLGSYFIVENDLNFKNDIVFEDKFCTYWVVGYWQRQMKFVMPTKILLNCLKMNVPNDNSIINLGREMRNVESVALGIRLYEEVENPNLIMSISTEIYVAKINKSIQQMQNDRPNIRFYVFCTHNSSFIDSLMLPKNSIFLTGDNGFYDPISSLWLISQCRHHIFTASSFYWWGAWLSIPIYQALDLKQKICMINNNFYLSAMQPEWESI